MAKLSYGDIDYWENRYRNQTTTFEWYQPYWSLQPLINSFFPKSEPVLQIGVGTSQIQNYMEEDGYLNIMNIDYSETLVNYMKRLRKPDSRNFYKLMDVTNMNDIEDCSYSSVFDKGTIDAIMCSNEPSVKGEQMFKEIYRVLKDGGVFIMVTYGEPEYRLNLLKDPDLPWHLTIYCIAKPTQFEQGQELAQRSQIRGPFRQEDVSELEAISQLQEAHYVYVCEKGQQQQDECTRDISRAEVQQNQNNILEAMYGEQENRSYHQQYNLPQLDCDKELLEQIDLLKENDRLIQEEYQQPKVDSPQGQKLHTQTERTLNRLEEKMDRLSNTMTGYPVANQQAAT